MAAKWQVRGVLSTDEVKLNTMLSEGWEPFAATSGIKYTTLWLRKKV